ncbi:MAG TPA: hypothetical protein PKW76_10175 [bacterium]|nr:hypothetical protein [bacterium]HPG46038.1 hypothetical protein [bacterium]HPM97860.1 hypothetical protein [bacterium]
MKKKQKNLWLYDEEELSEAERRALADQLHKQPEIARNYQDFSALRDSLGQIRRDRFQPFFVERVMARIRRQEQAESADFLFFVSLSRAFRRIAVVGCAVVVLLFACNLARRHASFGILSDAVVSLEDVILPAFSPSLEDIL